MGGSFRRFDSWTTSTTAHADLWRRWTGTTQFLMRTSYRKTTEKEADTPVQQALAEALAGQRAINGKREVEGKPAHSFASVRDTLRSPSAKDAAGVRPAQT